MDIILISRFTLLETPDLISLGTMGANINLHHLSSAGILILPFLYSIRELMQKRQPFCAMKYMHANPKVSKLWRVIFFPSYEQVFNVDLYHLHLQWCGCLSFAALFELLFSVEFLSIFIFRMAIQLCRRLRRICASLRVLYGRTSRKVSSSSTRFNIVLRPKIFQ